MRGLEEVLIALAVVTVVAVPLVWWIRREMLKGSLYLRAMLDVYHNTVDPMKYNGMVEWEENYYQEAVQTWRWKQKRDEEAFDLYVREQIMLGQIKGDK